VSQPDLFDPSAMNLEAPVGSLFKELKRRNVFRVAGAYAVVACLQPLATPDRSYYYCYNFLRSPES